jgi:hypothetical protein
MRRHTGHAPTGPRVSWFRHPPPLHTHSHTHTQFPHTHTHTHRFLSIPPPWHDRTPPSCTHVTPTAPSFRGVSFSAPAHQFASHVAFPDGAARPGAGAAAATPTEVGGGLGKLVEALEEENQQALQPNPEVGSGRGRGTLRHPPPSPPPPFAPLSVTLSPTKANLVPHKTGRRPRTCLPRCWRFGGSCCCVCPCAPASWAA